MHDQGRWPATQGPLSSGFHARNLRDGLSRLADTPYGWLVNSFPERDTISLLHIERKFDGATIRRAVNLFRRDPLGIRVAIACFKQKTNEVRNIRMILRGKVLGMQNEQILKWLIV